MNNGSTPRKGEDTSTQPMNSAEVSKGTEAEQNGGKQAARDQAENDWGDSAKESGE